MPASKWNLRLTSLIRTFLSFSVATNPGLIESLALADGDRY